MAGGAAPRVSVVLGTYNGERWLRPCIESLAAQTLRPLEIIVIDDGSSDGSLSTLRDLDGQFPGLLAVHEQDNQGVSSVMNRAISMCSGDYVAVADHDDIYPPHRLEASVALMSETGADMVGGQTIGGMGRWLRLHKSRFPTDPVLMADRIHKGLDPLAHTTMMVRRDGFDRFDGYRPLPRAADLELMLRWAHRGARIAVSPQVLAWYRLRREHFSIDVQTGWMLESFFAAECAVGKHGDVPDLANRLTPCNRGPARREARRRVNRLAVRLAIGTVTRERRGWLDTASAAGSGSG